MFSEQRLYQIAKFKKQESQAQEDFVLQLQHTFDLYLNMNHILRETFKIAKSILRKKNKNINS